VTDSDARKAAQDLRAAQGAESLAKLNEIERRARSGCYYGHIARAIEDRRRYLKRCR
jgi:hypothetical protein